MNAKQKLTELLRSKITSKLNEMNGDGPHIDKPGGWGKLSGWDPDGEFDYPQNLKAFKSKNGVYELVDEGELHPLFVNPEKSDGHYEAHHDQIDGLGQQVKQLHDDNMIIHIVHNGEILKGEDLASFVDGGRDSPLADAIKGALGPINDLHIHTVKNESDRKNDPDGI